MKASTWKVLLIVGIALISYTAVFAAGYYISSERDKSEVGERAFGNFMQGLSALSYLEKGNVDDARHILRITLDSDLVTISRFGTPWFDAYSAEKNPGAKARWLAQYDNIRKKYPPLDYSDGGAMNREVDQILDHARTSTEKR